MANKDQSGRIRLGLCCIFKNEPIRFRATTAKYLLRFDRSEQLAKLSGLCLLNSQNLIAALHYSHSHKFGAFRILSPLLPRFTHPDVGYSLADLPDALQIEQNFIRVKEFRDRHDIRLSFHPDQFIILSSPHKEVLEKSISELEYQAMLAEHIGAEIINIHGGGAYGDKQSALKRFRKNFQQLSVSVQKRLSLENDDRIYTVKNLLPVCKDLQIPLMYDVHHHRCNPDGLTVEEATCLSLETWEKVGREPYFHISSPKNGWSSSKPNPHADYIDPADFPDCWKGFDLTVDVEAKAKELAVLKLKETLKI